MLKKLHNSMMRYDNPVKNFTYIHLMIICIFVAISFMTPMGNIEAQPLSQPPALALGLFYGFTLTQALSIMIGLENKLGQSLFVMFLTVMIMGIILSIAESADHILLSFIYMYILSLILRFLLSVSIRFNSTKVTIAL